MRASLSRVAYVGASTNFGVMVRVLYATSPLALMFIFPSLPCLVVMRITPLAPFEP